MTKQRSFWVLQWSDGTYYAVGDMLKNEPVSHVADPMMADMFGSLKQAENFHKSYPQLCGHDMRAIEITIGVTVGPPFPLPACDGGN